ncbi:AAA-ATPase At3g28580 [Fagus crenata]
MKKDIWAQIGSTFASLLFVSAMLQRYFPHHLQVRIERCFHKFANSFNPYIEIIFHEFSGEYLKRNEAYIAIEYYLSSKSTEQAKRLKANVDKNCKSLVLTMDEHEEVLDEYEGVKLYWVFIKSKRYYKLTFHRRYLKFVTGSYLKYVMEEGKAIGVRNRQRKLYTNGTCESSQANKRNMWSHVVFQHPASFETLAMEPHKKKDIMDDLDSFRNAKEYYARIGKPWKRGYLLYGPPGTGKSTMIAAIANFMKYDIYDLELTAVKNNMELRKLLIETSSKSINVIEDIDCSLELTGKRKKKNKKDECKQKEESSNKLAEIEDESKSSKVTLSGLLNFIDGIWSASGGERLIIFTTNYVEKLDPALIRRGRMDKHIELTYCDFEGFKVLAKNYLNLDSHHLFDTIRCLLEEINMTHAEVAEKLIPKTVTEDGETTCLKSLIQVLKTAKEETRIKAELEARLRAEKDMNERKTNEKKASTIEE